MSTRRYAPWVTRIVSCAVLLAILLIAGLAAAAGRVQWSKTTVTESEGNKGSWKLELKIFMPKAPDVAHIPMKFEFTPIAYYERSIEDGDKHKDRRVPLEGRQDIIEGVEVGFLDPGSGKIEKGTMFSFRVTRAHGFEAGEYRVTIRDTRNGQIVGAPTTLKFEGENELIDRRTMVFADPKEKKKKKEGAEEKKEEGAEEKKEEGAEEKKEEGAEEKKEEGAEEKKEEGAEEKPGEIKEKPGGCGCRLEDARGDGELALWPLGLGVLLLAARRRRRGAPVRAGGP